MSESTDQYYTTAESAEAGSEQKLYYQATEQQSSTGSIILRLSTQTPQDNVMPGQKVNSKHETSSEPVKKKRSPRKKKDPNAPAGAASAYTLFFRDTQATIKATNPTAKFGEISKIVASMWEALGDDEKSKFKQRSAEDKIRHQREMEAYKAGQTLDQIPSSEAEEIDDEETNQVFNATDATTQIASHVKLQQEEEQKSENMCIKRGCSQAAIKSSEWDEEYCSNECAVEHCKDVFNLWIAKQNG